MLTKRTSYPVYEYIPVPSNLIHSINDLAKEGWEVHSTEVMEGTTVGYLLHRLTGWYDIDPAILEQTTKEASINWNRPPKKSTKRGRS
jgi:hypothetical protein